MSDNSSKSPPRRHVKDLLAKLTISVPGRSSTPARTG
jgi:hypothetical protein